MRCNSRQYHPRFGAGIAQIVDQQHAGVRLPIAMDQRADVVILGNEYPAARYRFGKQSTIARICRSPPT